MARTVNTPPQLPNPNVQPGSRIVGTSAGSSQEKAWARLFACVNSLFANKVPSHVDTHDADEGWLGYGYPTGSGNAARYRFPLPMVDLSPADYADGLVSVTIRGYRATAHVGASTSWVLGFRNAIDGSIDTYEVNGGTGAGAFTQTIELRAYESGATRTGDVQVYVDTFGGALGTGDHLTSIEVRPKMVPTGTELPLGIYDNTPPAVPMFALDPAHFAAAGDSASAAFICCAAALLEWVYRYNQPSFVFCAATPSGAASPQRMRTILSAYSIFYRNRVAALPAGSPGVSVWVYVIDSKVSGDGTIRFTAGANQTTIPNASLSSGAWAPLTSLSCRAGDLVTVEGNHIEIGSIIVFAREASYP